MNEVTVEPELAADRRPSAQRFLGVAERNVLEPGEAGRRAEREPSPVQKLPPVEPHRSRQNGR